MKIYIKKQKSLDIYLMNRAMEQRSLPGVKIANRAPVVIHLLFADDSLFFSLANKRSATTLKRIFCLYERVSGQAINFRKSSITFGSKVSTGVQTLMRNLLQIHNVGGIGKYLGLPEQFGGKKSDMLAYITDKVRAVTQGWKQKYLSHGGKEVLLKAVALAMPIFTMNVFRLPKEICEDINRILATFWWGSGNKTGLHWLAWKRVSKPKREGGLDFRDLEIFNQALLGKKVWRILQAPTCLMACILKGRYFPDCSILSATPKTHSSYAWKSILFGKELVVKGMRMVVGNGTTTKMWTDPWIPDHPPRPPRSLNEDLSEVTVNSFMNADRRSWNIMKLEAEVVPEDIDKILSIKLCSTAELDLLGWSYNEDGIYTVKSGYWLSTHLPEYDDGLPIPGDPIVKQKMWKTRLPPKLKHFLWRLLSHSLPTGSNLQRRHAIRDSQCRRCCQHEETEKHLFLLLFLCQTSVEFFRY